jgi:basic membrane lipoprotein Med (substrate-binding protein (PBP1-ABC) superfamily)
VKTTFVENVPESAADAERVIRDLATQGNKVIFGTTFGYMEAMLKVAKDFPDVNLNTQQATKRQTIWRNTMSLMKALIWRVSLPVN